MELVLVVLKIKGRGGGFKSQNPRHDLPGHPHPPHCWGVGRCRVRTPLALLGSPSPEQMPIAVGTLII